MDMAETSPKTQKKVSAILTELTNVFTPFFECLRGAAKIEMTPEEAAIQFISVLEGVILVARSHQDIKFIRKGIRKYRNLIMALVP